MSGSSTLGTQSAQRWLEATPPAAALGSTPQTGLLLRRLRNLTLSKHLLLLWPLCNKAEVLKVSDNSSTGCVQGLNAHQIHYCTSAGCELP